jgi:hypothetical protein
VDRGSASSADWEFETDRLVKTDMAPPTSYLDDVRFDPGRAAEGVACITDSSDQGPSASW